MKIKRTKEELSLEEQMALESGCTSPKKKIKYVKPWTMVFLTNLVIGVFCFNAYLMQKNSMLIKYGALENNEVIAEVKPTAKPTAVPVTTTPTPTVKVTATPTNTPEEIVINSGEIFDQQEEKIEKYLVELFSGNVIYDQKKDEVEYANNNFEFDMLNNAWLSINIRSYKYFEGVKFVDLYESIEWERILDEDVKVFNDLLDGKQVADVFTEVGGKQQAEVRVVYFGDRKYLIYDTHFNPAASWHRNYITFDQTNNQLVNISIGYRTHARLDDVSYDRFDGEKPYYTNVKYPELIEGFMDEFESMLGRE